MRRPERGSLTGDAQRELDALDTALVGDEVQPEHARLAELAIALHELRPRASEEFIRTLDTQAEQSFGRAHGELDPGKAQRRGRWLPSGRIAFGRARAVLWRPASGLALAAIVALAVAVPLLASGPHHTAPRPVPLEHVFGPATTKPESSSGRTRAPALEAAPARAPGGASSAEAGSPSATKTAATPANTSAAAGASTRLIERTATLDVGVAPEAIESSAQRVFTLVSAFGGYVRQSSVSSGEPARGVEPAHGEEGQRGGASFDIRVPSANLSGAIAALAHLGHVRSESNTTNDVTDQHASLRTALGEAQAERSSLLAQLRKATAEPERALLKSRLHAADERIGQLEGQLRALDQRVTYTSLALSLTAEAPSGGTATGGDLTPGGAAHDAATILDAALAVLVIAAAALLPVTALAIAAWIAIATTRRRLREHALDAS